MSARSAADRSDIGRVSILLQMMRIGLLLNSGLIEWNSAACCTMVYPHCSLTSTMYRHAARRCARAVMLCRRGRRA